MKKALHAFKKWGRWLPPLFPHSVFLDVRGILHNYDHRDMHSTEKGQHVVLFNHTQVINKMMHDYAYYKVPYHTSVHFSYVRVRPCCQESSSRLGGPLYPTHTWFHTPSVQAQIRFCFFGNARRVCAFFVLFVILMFSWNYVIPSWLYI